MDGIYRQLAQFKTSSAIRRRCAPLKDETDANRKAVTRSELFKGARGYLHAEGRPARP